MFNLVITLLLSYLIRYAYIRFSPSLSNKKDFANNFIVLGIATCLIITIVKNSIALSLGLVGALSIVRFRAAIKEPGELVYLFLVIASGIGCGSGQVKITILGIVFSLAAVFLSTKILNNKGVIDRKSYNLLITLEIEDISKIEFDAFTQKLKKLTSDLEFISMHKTSTEIILSYDVILDKLENLNKITEEINNSFEKSQLTISKNEFLPA